MTLIQCPTCKGRGKLPIQPGAWKVCVKCEGDGFLVKETGQPRDKPSDDPRRMGPVPNREVKKL